MTQSAGVVLGLRACPPWFAATWRDAVAARQAGRVLVIRDADDTECDCACGCHRWAKGAATLCPKCVRGVHSENAELLRLLELSRVKERELVAARAALTRRQRRAADFAARAANPPTLNGPRKPQKVPPVPKPTADDIAALLERVARPQSWCSCSCVCSNRHLDGELCFGCLNGRRGGSEEIAARLLALKAKYAKK